jgi:hypothetical protein
MQLLLLLVRSQLFSWLCSPAAKGLLEMYGSAWNVGVDLGYELGKSWIWAFKQRMGCMPS